MKELNSVLHVAGNERTERLTQVKTAAEVALTSLRARFPEAEGYRFKVTDTAPSGIRVSQRNPGTSRMELGGVRDFHGH